MGHEIYAMIWASFGWGLPHYAGVMSWEAAVGGVGDCPRHWLASWRGRLWGSARWSRSRIIRLCQAWKRLGTDPEVTKTGQFAPARQLLEGKRSPPARSPPRLGGESGRCVRNSGNRDVARCKPTARCGPRGGSSAGCGAGWWTRTGRRRWPTSGAARWATLAGRRSSCAGSTGETPGTPSNSGRMQEIYSVIEMECNTSTTLLKVGLNQCIGGRVESLTRINP